MSERQRLSFTRHPDDRGIDEILFLPEPCPTVDGARATAFLRIRLQERYKTSELSGDEWRFSTVAEFRREPRDEWEPFDTGYRDLETHAKALYPGLFGDFLNDKHGWLHVRKVGAIAFTWKGLPVWSATYDGKATDLMVAIGHLSWALIMAGEQGASPHDGLQKLCCQPGCAEPHVSVYRKKKNYCHRCGTAREPIQIGNRLTVRGFCAKHLRRGDCGLDDADVNYEVVSGLGPGEHEPDPNVVTQSGVVYL